METVPQDLDVQAYCRGLALQQIQMLTRLAEIAMQLAEAEGTRAIAAQAKTAEPKADETAVQAARAEAQEAGMAFSRSSRSVQRSLLLRSRAAADLCAGDKADRRARRARQRNHVTDALEALVWDPELPAGPRDRTEARIAELHEGIAALYEDEDNRVEDRPVGPVIAGLACGFGLSDAWRRRAPDWSGPPWPAPPEGTDIKAQRRARLAELMRLPLLYADADQVPELKAGIEARLREPDIPALLDAEPPMRVAEHLCLSLGLEPFPCLDWADKPDTG